MIWVWLNILAKNDYQDPKPMFVSHNIRNAAVSFIMYNLDTHWPQAQSAEPHRYSHHQIIDTGSNTRAARVWYQWPNILNNSVQVSACALYVVG